MRILGLVALLLFLATPASAATIGTRERGYDLQFDPSRIEVDAGEVVTFTSGGRFAHTLTSPDGRFDTGHKPPGEERTFHAPTEPGEYPFVCRYHEQMQGVLIVRAAEAVERATGAPPASAALAVLAAVALAATRRRARSRKGCKSAKS